MANAKENMAVALLSERLALACGYDCSMAELIKWAARYHDVGKSLLPKDLLQKPDNTDITLKHCINPIPST